MGSAQRRVLNVGRKTDMKPARAQYPVPEDSTVATKKPSLYMNFQDKYPKYFTAVETLGATVRDAGPLPEKTLHLVQLAAAAAVRSEGAVHSHVRRGLACGLKPEEIRHALLAVTSTIGFPNVIAAMSWAEDVLDKSRPQSRKR
jgi:4-carboxymuconolactone decarboxylase